MLSKHAIVYRGILRELSKAAVTPRKTNQIVATRLRSIIEKARQSDSPTIFQDVQNTLLFLRSQREYKLLLERYNPLIDLTAEERIQATARRVGLNMPITHTTERGQ
ncbi:hypothetical protein BDZ94DRAFT_1165592 [Collybia nuda]|uniref:Uncharacterized protein n=1 Tax=Collybia nuda TaxID=64659 RepID=A0A9P5Y5G8_9AGAR|nr:hypothetical protein BDZ94DRAFT_1165592 [Collybia nuda]